MKRNHKLHILTMQLVLLVFAMFSFEHVNAKNIYINNTNLDGSHYTGTTEYGSDVYYYFDVPEGGSVVDITCARQNASNDMLVLILWDVYGNKELARGKGNVVQYVPEGEYAAIVYWTDCDYSQVISYEFYGTLTSFGDSITNSTPDNAIAMESGKIYSEEIIKGAGVNCYYQIDVPENAKVVVKNLKWRFGNKIYSDITLKDCIFASDSNDSKDYRVLDLSKGTYYIEVYSNYDKLDSFEFDVDIETAPAAMKARGSVDPKTNEVTLTWTKLPECDAYHVYRQNKDQSWELEEIVLGQELKGYTWDKLSVKNDIYSFTFYHGQSEQTAKYAVVPVRVPLIGDDDLKTDKENHVSAPFDDCVFSVSCPEVNKDTNQNTSQNMNQNNKQDDTFVNLNNTQDNTTGLSRPGIVSLKNKKGKKMIVKWNRIVGVSQIQIQYSTKQSFAKKNTKVIKLSGTKTSNTIGKLQKKTYYVRIRYVKNGKTSQWSKVKKLKIKK